jgi:hypothetical protein
MSRFSALLSRSIFSGVVFATFAGNSAALAESTTYRGSGFTVTITSNETGYHYHGCDSKNNCINLDGGSRWRDGGQQGLFWFGKDSNYTYGISHNSDSSIRLVAAKKTKRLLDIKLFPVATQARSNDSATCQVTNIQSGQLALRSSPGGASLAGLDNGNSVVVEKKQRQWAYVRVTQSSDRSVTNLQGWVNSSYLACDR